VTVPIGSTGASSTTDSSALAGQAVLGKDDFLRILVAQLRNQDPMSPMEGTEFATQLAQFSSVEQLIQLGEQMKVAAAGTTELKLTAQTTLGASMVGRDVLLNGDALTVGDDGGSRVVAEFPTAAKDVAIRVLGADGVEVMTQNFSDVASGRRTFSLDTGNLAPGTYQYEVIATDANKAVVTATPFTIGRVEGMAFRGGTISLRVNGTLVPMLDVVEVMADPGTTSGVPTTQEQTTP
jgi:flagellar basal-body rod modification protein FlgD